MINKRKFLLLYLGTILGTISSTKTTKPKARSVNSVESKHSTYSVRTGHSKATVSSLSQAASASYLADKTNGKSDAERRRAASKAASETGRFLAKENKIGEGSAAEFARSINSSARSKVDCHIKEGSVTYSIFSENEKKRIQQMGKDPQTKKLLTETPKLIDLCYAWSHSKQPNAKKEIIKQLKDNAIKDEKNKLTILARTTDTDKRTIDNIHTAFIEASLDENKADQFFSQIKKVKLFKDALSVYSSQKTNEAKEQKQQIKQLSKQKLAPQEKISAWLTAQPAVSNDLQTNTNPHKNTVASTALKTETTPKPNHIASAALKDTQNTDNTAQSAGLVNGPTPPPAPQSTAMKNTAPQATAMSNDLKEQAKKQAQIAESAKLAEESTKLEEERERIKQKDKELKQQAEAIEKAKKEAEKKQSEDLQRRLQEEQDKTKIAAEQLAEATRRNQEAEDKLEEARRRTTENMASTTPQDPNMTTDHLSSTTWGLIGACVVLVIVALIIIFWPRKQESINEEFVEIKTEEYIDEQEKEWFDI